MKKILIIAFLFASCTIKSSQNIDFYGNWIEVMPSNPNIIEGFRLDSNGIAHTIGMATLQYNKWKLKDNHFIICGKSIGNGVSFEFTDTLDIIKITPDSLILDKYGKYRIKYYKVKNLKDIKPFNILDSLHTVYGETEIETTYYQDSSSTASCIEVRNNITIYNYKNSGDGVYKKVSTFYRPNGDMPQDTSYGRVYTLRGDDKDPNITMLELIPFNGGDTLIIKK